MILVVVTFELFAFSKLQMLDISNCRGCKRCPSKFGLGPILFVIYVNDLADNLMINHFLYANDVKLVALKHN